MDDEGIADFHHVIHQHFHIVRPGDFKFDSAEDDDVDGVLGDFLEGEFGLVLAQHGGLVGGDQTDGFVELAIAGGPAIEDAETGRGDGDFRHAHGMKNADEHETAADFLADFLAEKRALQIGEDSGWGHGSGVVEWSRLRCATARQGSGGVVE